MVSLWVVGVAIVGGNLMYQMVFVEIVNMRRELFVYGGM